MSVTVALAGNPNCGKTALFNRLTGARQQVGNWPGVTVERKQGVYRHAGEAVAVVDLPGVYSLEAAGDDAGLDAHVALEFLLGGAPDVVVDVVDQSNLERNLYLTAQLLELGVPLVVALTMGDVPAARRRPVDAGALAARLGCAVVAVNPRRGRGLGRLRDAIAGAVGQRAGCGGPVYAPAVEAAINALRARLPGEARGRWRALALLSADATAEDRVLAGAVVEQRAALERALGDDVDIVLADARYGFVHELAAGVTHAAGRVSASMSDRLDRVVLNRWLGIPIFLGAMYLLFTLTINVGGAFIDFFDILAGALFVEGLGNLLTNAGAPDWARIVLADGAGGGIQTVATFIPIVGTLFLFLCALEDSGYMARAAFVMDRVMRLVGLPGRSFVPLLLGFGCNVPAILATRTLESRRDRLLTILMNPFMSCGARLPVYALFAVAFFGGMGQNVVFALYLIGMAAAVLTGLVLRHTLLRGHPTPFVMELPAYHLPAPRSLLIHTWARLQGFALGAGKVIVTMVVALTILGSLSTNGHFGQDDGPSMLDSASRTVTPALAPLGIQNDNWPATVGIVTGIFAKEAVAGTLDSLYGSLAGPTDQKRPFSLPAEARAALASITTNLTALAGTLGDPVGVSIADDTTTAQADASRGTFTEMRHRFDGAAGAFAYLLFILLYFPCAAATGAIYRETNARWTVFAAAWTTGLAYATATIAYQTATFPRHPASSTTWITGTLLALGLTIATMRLIGRRTPPDRTAEPLPSPAGSILAGRTP